MILIFEKNEISLKYKVQQHSFTMEIIIDPIINEQAKLSRTEFSERIENVESIRTREIKIGFYLDDIRKLHVLENLHQIINSGKFKEQIINHNKILALGIPLKLYNWFNNTTLATFHKQILNWHAAYYAFNSFQKFADEELDPLILEEVKNILNQYYQDNYLDNYNLDNIEDEDQYKTKKESSLKHYYNVSKNYTGSLPPEFLKNPYNDPSSNIADDDNDWGLIPNCQFSIIISYFNNLDWIIIVERSREKLIEFYKDNIENKKMTLKQIDRIIENAENDTLKRAESDDEMWQKWKYTFQNYELRKEYTFNIIPREKTKTGYVYLNQDETGATKIGWTSKIGSERITGIQTGNPTKVIERGRFNASNLKTEKVLHKIFEEKRTRENGEWFWLTENDIENILDNNWRMKNNIF